MTCVTDCLCRFVYIPTHQQLTSQEKKKKRKKINLFIINMFVVFIFGCWLADSISSAQRYILYIYYNTAQHICRDVIMVNIGCAEGKGKANNKEKSQVNECLVATIGCHKWPLPTKNN